jgi:hypothetical protein
MQIYRDFMRNQRWPGIGAAPTWHYFYWRYLEVFISDERRQLIRYGLK